MADPKSSAAPVEDGDQDSAHAPSAKPRPSFLRRAWPWLVGVAILVIIAVRVPVDAFRGAIGKGPHVLLAFVTLGVTTSVLVTDSFSTWVGLRAAGIARPLSRVAAVRGATYVLFLVNYAVGQGAFGFYLNRTGVTALRAVGVTLFLIGTNLAALLVVTTVAWALVFTRGGDPANAALWWTLLAGCAAFAAYLVVIVVAPPFLARRQLFAPLFEAGLAGHALAMLGRLPHTAVMVIGHWAAVRAWGIEVPLSAGLTLMPAVVIASVLPISPAGLGTTQAALVYFFSSYAEGATTDDRQAAVLAFAVVYFVYGVLTSLIVGLACMPFAKRFGVLAPSAARAT